MPVVPKITNSDKFLEDFLGYYFARGFGSVSKRECDMLLVHLLDLYSDLGEKKNQPASVALGLPESRLRALRYEAKLKFPPGKDYVQVKLLWALAQAHFESAKDRVLFSIEDTFVRQALLGLLKERGSFGDSSFNSEIVSIRSDPLADLIESVYGKKTGDVFRREFKKAKKGDDPSFLLNVIKEVAATITATVLTQLPSHILASLGIHLPPPQR